MNHGSLFSGIGGFDLAAEWMGWTNVFNCENNPFCQHVLRHYWPNAISYGDIKTTDFAIHRGRVDIISGGFPCQPFSTAGDRKGSDDDRFLWPAMFRSITEIKPTWVVAENVRGLLTIANGMVFERMCLDLEAEGFYVQPFIIPACATGAPHRRDRVWIVAYSDTNDVLRKERRGITKQKDISQFDWEKHGASGKFTGTINNAGKEQIVERYEDASNGTEPGLQKFGPEGEREPGEENKEGVRRPELGDSDDTDTFYTGLQGDEQQFTSRSGSRSPRPITKSFTDEHWLEAAARLCVVDDGFSRRLLDITLPRWRKESLMAVGNAIVPQVAYKIFQAIEHSMK